MASEKSLEDLVDNYSGRGFLDIAPLESWTTEDIVRLIHLADVELQERHYREHEFDGDI